jgi:putative transposase
MKKVAPSERYRAELDEARAGIGEQQDPVEAIGRLGARLILQQALEDEVTESLGRRRYERAEETVSHRTGYERTSVRTTSGKVALERPRVRDASKLGFESRVLGKHVTRTYALESLVISSFLRGLSTRDVEAALEEVFDESIVSRQTVSRVLEDTRERYRRWWRRRLEQHDVVYLFLDAIYLKLPPDDTPAEGVLVAWGVTLEGRKVLRGLQLGSRESHESWLAFGRDLVARGMNAPALIVADGAPGLWKAVRELWPRAGGQRCTVHALRNVTSKLAERHHAEVKARWWKVLDDATSPAEARRGLEAIIADYQAAYPSAMAVIERDLDALVVASALALQAPQTDPHHEPARENVRGGPPPHQGDRTVPRRDVCPVRDLGRARALKPRLARRHHDPKDRRRDRTQPPPSPPHQHERHQGGDRRLASTPSGSYARTISPGRCDATPAEGQPLSGPSAMSRMTDLRSRPDPRVLACGEAWSSSAAPFEREAAAASMRRPSAPHHSRTRAQRRRTIGIHEFDHRLRHDRRDWIGDEGIIGRRGR